MSHSLRRGYVDGPYGQLHYADQGTGRVVILIHMSGFDHTQFTKAIPILADAGFRAIAIDLPGFGMSDPSPSAPMVSDYALAVSSLVDALDVDSAVMVGSHLGALIASEVAVKYPALVERLVLAGPMPTTLEERTSHGSLIEAEKNAMISTDGSHLMEMWNLVLHYFQGWTDIEAVQRLVISQFSAGSRNWYGHNAVFSYDHASTLAIHKQPCLILNNTGDINHIFSLRTRDKFPEFKYQELKGGTALIVDEQPAEWTNAVIKFARNS